VAYLIDRDEGTTVLRTIEADGATDGAFHIEFKMRRRSDRPVPSNPYGRTTTELPVL